MRKLETLIEMNKLGKENRRNKLEHKLKQKGYANIEVLFDPLTLNSETTSISQGLENII